jgi:hypothetical protein
VTTFGTLSNIKSMHFNKIHHLPFNIPNVRSTAIMILDCIKFQYRFSLESPLFEPLNGRIKQGLIGYVASPICLYDLNFLQRIICLFWLLGTLTNRDYFLPYQGQSFQKIF